MLLAFFIYFTLLIILCKSAVTYSKNPIKEYKTNVLFPILFFAIIIGLRDGVGIDFNSYKLTYESNYDYDRLEFGFKFLINILRFLNLPATALFVVVAFLQLYIFSKLTTKYPPIYGWSLFYYFTTLYLFFSINGLRQALAFSCLVWSIYYIHVKDIKRYIVLLFLAVSFHFSAIILAPAYFLINREYIGNKYIYLLIYFSSISSGVLLADTIWIYLDMAINSFGIEGYNIATLYDVVWKNDSSRGFGFYYWLMMDLFTIINYPQLKVNYRNYFFIPCYNLYFIGVCLEPVLGSSYLMRFNIYFVYFRIIIYSFIAHWVFTRHINVLYKTFMCLMLLGIILFMCQAILVSASGCSPYSFVF